MFYSMPVVVFLIFNSINILAAEAIGKTQTFSVSPNNGNKIMVRVEGHSNSANYSTACATNSYWTFAFDSSLAGGKELYSLILAAYFADQNLVFKGAGTCTVHGDAQDIAYVRPKI